MAYCTIANVRALGILEADASDAIVTAAITWAQSYIDHYTGNHFEKITYTTAAPLLVDGSGTEILELPIPVSPAAGSLTKVTLDDVEQDLTQIVIYNRLVPDDRRYPKLAFKQAPALTEYEKMITTRSVWSEGTQNVVLEGDFGFLTLAEGTPSDITDLTSWVVVMRLANIGIAAAGQLMANIMDNEITAESTRDRSVTYKGGGLGASSMRSQPTGYYILDEMIARYRRLK